MTHTPNDFRASEIKRGLRRISEIEESLARPVESGTDWDRRRAQLEAELHRLLTTCKATVQHLGPTWRGDEMDALYDEARAAIAKAGERDNEHHRPDYI